MTHKIRVTLDQSVTPPVLALDHRRLRVDQQTGSQKVTWKLHGDLDKGTFSPIGGNASGFEWLKGAPSGAIFSKPEVKENGKTLELFDTHADKGSDGAWEYRLRVILDGKPYETADDPDAADAAAARGNPIIINH